MESDTDGVEHGKTVWDGGECSIEMVMFIMVVSLIDRIFLSMGNGWRWVEHIGEL